MTQILLADLGLHVIGVGYQVTLSPGFVLQVDADWWTPWTRQLVQYQTDETGVLLRARPVWYFDDAPTGSWISPFAQAGPARATVDGELTAGWAGAVGLSLGFSWLLREHLHAAIGGGAQFDWALFPPPPGTFCIDTCFPPGFAGLWPHLDATVGYAF